jgi:hypothetical protein
MALSGAIDTSSVIDTSVNKIDDSSHVCIYFYLSIYVSIYLSMYLSIYASLSLYVSMMSLDLCIYLSMNLCIYVYMYL